jgi:hypothetical protein
MTIVTVETMDLNTVSIRGRIATPPAFYDESGIVRLLVTVRSNVPTRRVDVLPVVAPSTMAVDVAGNPTIDLNTGDTVLVSGRMVRQFDDHPTGRRSSLVIQAIGIYRKDQP